jgi:negative regulator of flagellin synthesis FlgM
MVSEITGTRSGAVYTPETGHGANGVNQANRSERKSSVNSAKETENVVLTDAAVKLQAIEQAVAKASPVDDKRVEAVKQAIDDGSYRIEPERIAQKLMQTESLLPHKPKA